ncbi:MAG: methyltransferase, partial [Thermoplasmata archaeon]|nr:methyltransferase [Thermoplasmata archaeon]
IGDVLVMRIPREGWAGAREIAKTYAIVLGARTVVEDRSGIHGRLRTPDVHVLWGGGTETVHTEAGVRYTLDVARVMFSSGNLGERNGVASRIPAGAVVVDLFAGIGYFTLPIAVHSRAKTVYACELNPIAFQYLQENLRINRVTNVVALKGNCRVVAPRGRADWVIMGHFDARNYLDVAIRALRRSGTILYHELCPKEQYPDAMTRRLAASARAHWMNIRSMRTRIVKSYAPGIVHAVAEFEVAPEARGHPPKL